MLEDDVEHAAFDVFRLVMCVHIYFEFAKYGPLAVLQVGREGPGLANWPMPKDIRCNIADGHASFFLVRDARSLKGLNEPSINT